MNVCMCKMFIPELIVANTSRRDLGDARLYLHIWQDSLAPSQMCNF